MLYAALSYTHMDAELPCEHSWQVQSNDILFNGIHLCNHWIDHTCPTPTVGILFKLEDDYLQFECIESRYLA